MYHHQHKFTEEFLRNLNAKAKAYPLGTIVICADGIKLLRVRKMFVKVEE